MWRERYVQAPVQRLRQHLPAIGRLALYLVVALALVQIAFVALAELAARSVYGYFQHLDAALPLALHQRATPALTLLFLALTLLGSGAGNAILTPLFAWLLMARRSVTLGAWLVLVMLGGWWLEGTTKLVVQRARPDLFRLAMATGYSFPSGHAVLATCLYGALALIYWRWARGWQRAALAALAVVMPLLIGLSRVYLGVHYPSDVVGGWIVGAMWLGASCVVLRRYRPG